MRRIAAVIALLVIGCSAVLARPQPLPPAEIPHGLGLNIHFRRGADQLDMIRGGGFTTIRMDLTWEAVERQKGVYSFEEAGYDALTDGCAARDIQLLYILDYGNDIYEDGKSVRTEQGRRAYADFAAAAAERYAGQKILWEIWNEPNLEKFWSPQPSVEDYCKLVKKAAPRIRRADPSGMVLAGATSEVDLEWLESCFERGLLKWVDAVSVHPYRGQRPETVIEDYARLRELIDRHAPEGKDVPVLSSEWGYDAPKQKIARYMVRMFLVNKHCDIPVSIWYMWKNGNRRFGVVNNDLEPKPGYRAMQTLADTLGGYRMVKRLSAGSEKDYVLKLKNDGRTAYALWTTGQEHEMSLPVPGGEGTLVTMLGEERELSWQKGDEITVSGSPRYLLP